MQSVFMTSNKTKSLVTGVLLLSFALVYVVSGGTLTSSPYPADTGFVTVPGSNMATVAWDGDVQVPTAELQALLAGTDIHAVLVPSDPAVWTDGFHSAVTVTDTDPSSVTLPVVTTFVYAPTNVMLAAVMVVPLPVCEGAPSSVPVRGTQGCITKVGGVSVLEWSEAGIGFMLSAPTTKSAMIGMANKGFTLFTFPEA